MNLPKKVISFIDLRLTKYNNLFKITFMRYHNHISVKRHCDKLQQMAAVYNELSNSLNDQLRAASVDIPEDLADSDEYDQLHANQRRIIEFLQRIESVMHSFDLFEVANLG